MPLSIRDCHQRTIVDWGFEWIGRVEGKTDGKQRAKDYIPRGIIVKVDGDATEQAVQGIWVCLGNPSEQVSKDLAKRESKNLKVNGKEVTCYKFEGSELVRVYAWNTKPANTAWNRLFGFPTSVGTVRKQSTSHRAVRHVEDNLALTSMPKNSIVEESDEVPGMDLPAEEA